MSVNKQARLAREQAKPTVLQIDYTDLDAVDGSGTYQLTVRDTCVHVTAATASGDYTVYLPSVIEAKGELYSFHATIANSKSVLILHKDSDSYDWDGSTGYDLDVTDDGILLYSDGRTWWVAENRVS